MAVKQLELGMKFHLVCSQQAQEQAPGSTQKTAEGML